MKVFIQGGNTEPIWLEEYDEKLAERRIVVEVSEEFYKKYKELEEANDEMQDELYKLLEKEK